MSLNFCALVLNPGDAEPQCKVLVAPQLRGCAAELRKRYLKPGGEAVIYDGNPLNPLHHAKKVGTAWLPSVA